MEQLTEAVIPVIDLTVWRSSDTKTRAALAQTWYSAFATQGMVWVTGHGLEHIYREVDTEWRHFCRMDQQEKDRYSSAHYGASGYNCIGKEAVARSDGEEGDPDPVESLECGYTDQFLGPFPRCSTLYPRGDSLYDCCQSLYTSLESSVLTSCLSIASLALHMEESELGRKWLEAGRAACQLRLARYTPGGNHYQKGELLYGEHTDYDGFTFLWRNQTNGLQALVDGTWVGVPLLTEHPDALLVNLGDLMETWTGSVWHSPRHKVLRYSRDSSNKDLISVVFFAGPHPDTKLYRLPSPLLAQEGELEGQEGVVTAGQHVMDKIARTNQKV